MKEKEENPNGSKQKKKEHEENNNDIRTRRVGLTLGSDVLINGVRPMHLLSASHR